MDLLGSIMKNMTAPPALGEKEKLARKKQQEELIKQKKEEQRRINMFRERLKDQISKFVTTEAEVRLTLEPMNKPQRTIVYDMLEQLGHDLVSHSFGKEEVDRHVIIFKPEHVPCEAELLAMRRGETYHPVEFVPDEEVPEPTIRKLKQSTKTPPGYLQKYEKHLGGLEVAKDAARSTETVRSYGFVSSELKKDKRTIEETLEEIRARKKQKLNTTQN